jgi:hypothetical protein
VGGDVSVDSEALLVTDFMYLMIKLTQSFEGVYRGIVCVYVFIGVSARTYNVYEYLCLYCVSKKRNRSVFVHSQSPVKVL